MYSQFLHLRPNCQTPIQAWETLNPNMSHAALLLSLSLLKRWCTQMYHDSSWQNLTIQQSEWWLACDPWAHMMVMAPPPPPSLPTRLDGSHHTLSSHPFPKHCYLRFQIFQCRNIISSDNFGVPSQLSWLLRGVSKNLPFVVLFKLGPFISGTISNGWSKSLGHLNFLAQVFPFL